MVTAFKDVLRSKESHENTMILVIVFIGTVAADHMEAGNTVKVFLDGSDELFVVIKINRV